MKSKIVSGFAGIGKTYLAKVKDEVIDLESSLYQYGASPSDDHEKQKGDKSRKLNQNWLEDYLDAIEEHSKLGYKYILVAQFPELLEGMKKRKFKFTMVIPAEGQKEIYKERYQIRGNRESWIEDMLSRHDLFLETNKKYASENKIKLIQLPKGKYLKDILHLI